MSHARLVRITPTGDRRKDKRVQVSLNANVGGIPGEIVNLSLGGAGFSTMVPGLEPGETTYAVIDFSEGSMEFEVEIIGREEEDDSGIIGLHFINLNRQMFDRLQRAVVDPLHGL